MSLMHLFYSTDILDNRATLSPEESAHCIRVLRMKRGDQLNIIDGKGHLFDAYIDDPDPAKCGAVINSITSMPHPRKSKLHIAIAPTKSIDRFEWFVEKAVEIGIDGITPIICERSERRELKTDRIHKVVINSMKQANIYYKPEIMQATPAIQYIVKNSNQTGCFIAHCAQGNRFNLSTSDSSEIKIMIGPEGDFSNKEIETALNSGFIPVTLGPNRLRTETAGIVACHTVNLLESLR